MSVLLGPYGGYIAAAYAVALVVVAGLVLWARIDYARRTAELAALEASGVRRRSAGPAGATLVDGPAGESAKA